MNAFFFNNLEKKLKDFSFKIINFKKRFLPHQFSLPDAFLYALPSFFIWNISLLVFWPGMMSHDSIIQWRQLSNNSYNNIQPPLHTLFMKVITLFFNSPGAVAFIQLTFLCIALGLFLNLMKKMNVQTKYLWIASLLTAFSPINLVLSITIWKDIIYTFTVVLCCLTFLKIGIKGSSWFLSNRNILYLSISLALPFLIRWNGLSITVGGILFLFIYYPKMYRRFILSGIITISFILTIKGPIFDYLNVKKDNWLMYNLPIHQMGAFLSSNVEFNNDEISFLNKISDTSNSWDYECGKAIANAWGKTLMYDKNYFFENKAEFMDIYIRKVLKNPLALIKYYKCSSRYIWDPFAYMVSKKALKTIPRPSDKINNFNTYDGIRWIPYVNEFKIESDSYIPALVKPFTLFIKKTILFWKPAIFLYLVIILVIVNFIYKSKVVLLLVPIVLHTLGLALVSIAPEFRFQYPLVFISHFAWVSIFIKNE